MTDGADEKAALLAQVDALEAEMRRIGFWREPPPDGGAGPMDGSGFEAWLQNTFIPTARARIQADDLPEKSMMGVLCMRQYDYHGTCEDALPLVSMMHEFDDLVEQARRAASGAGRRQNRRGAAARRPKRTDDSGG